MKFLHISDLHIGKNVNGFSMLEEQEHSFEQVLTYIDTQKPDALIIAGDVYDRALPAAEAVACFDNFLTSLSEKNITVMLISGNHDSGERLNYASRLLQDKNLFLCGTFDGVVKKVELHDEYGEVNFYLMPFIKPSLIKNETYYDAFAASLARAEIDWKGRNVLVSHQFFRKAGHTALRSDSEVNPIGTLDAIEADLIEKFDYAALGHLHGAQSVGAAHLRYAGSPVKYSFSEALQKKSITLVELKEKGNVRIEALELKPLHDMREIKGKLEALLDPKVRSLAPADDYIRVVLTDEEEIVDPMGKLRTVYPNIMNLSFENTRTKIDFDIISGEISNVEKLSPYNLFAEFFLKTQGSVMTDEQCEIVRTLLEETEEDE